MDSSEGRRRVSDYLHNQPYPHYEPHPEKTGLLIRIEANDKRTVGRFVNREFQPVQAKPGK